MAAAGTQDGEDLGARSRGDLAVAVECKLYELRTRLDMIGLMGKMTAALTANSDLDLWVLAVTRDVPARLDRQLSQLAERLGIDVLLIDHDAFDLGPLPALCASAPDITLSALPRAAARRIAPRLEEIRRAPRFETVIGELRRGFSGADLGYASVRSQTSARFTSALASIPDSFDLFGQRLLPLAEGALDLPRAAVDEQLDDWWRRWPACGRVLLLHGAEGTGKSWGLASWLARQALPAETAPLLIWCDSDEFDFSPLPELGARLLERARLESGGQAALAKRLRRWISGTEATDPAPRVLYVVDGLNERPRRNDWWRWLVTAQRDLAEHFGRAALILTCRTSYWEQVRPNYRSEREASRSPIARPAAEPPAPREVLVDDFTEQELDRLLATSGLAPSPLEPRLRQLLRRPRLFQLAVLHWRRYEESGDFTVARLSFEQWRHLAEQKAGHTLSDEDYQRVLRDIAMEFQQRALGRPDLAHRLAGVEDVDRKLEDLISGGVFEPAAGAAGSLRLETNRLYLALGLQLVAAVSAAPASLEAAIEAAEKALETGAGSDETALIAENAVCVALTASAPQAPPRHVKLALLLALARLRNGGDAWERSRPWSYYPAAPDIFQDLAETEWSQEDQGLRARERIGYAFVCICEQWPAHPALIATCRRWLSFIDLPATQPRRALTAAQLHAFQRGIEDQLAAASAFTGAEGITPVAAAGEALLYLSSLALLVMSASILEHGPQAVHVAALGAWALRGAVMGPAHDFDQAAWVVRLAGEPLWPALVALADRLATRPEPLLRAAAARLLLIEGSPGARERVAALDPLPWDQSPDVPERLEEARQALATMEPARAAAWLSERALDPEPPLEGVAWRSERLLRSIDLAELATGRQTTGADLDLDRAEPALSRTAPAAFGRFGRRVIDFILRQLSARTDVRTWLLDEHFLLLSRRQAAQARVLVAELEQTAPERKDGKSSEAVWDLTGLVLASLTSANAQRRFLLARAHRLDSADWSGLLAPLAPREVRTVLGSLPRSGGLARRRQLWFPWREPVPLTDRARRTLRTASQDAEVGASIAGLVPQRARDPELLLSAVQDGVFDDDWLSRILEGSSWARAALAQASAETRHRLGPESLSWVVLERGLDDTEVRSWALDLDHALLHPQSGSTAVANRGWIATETVAAARRAAPQVVAGWIAALAGGTQLSTRLANVHFSLTSALLLTVLNADDACAAESFGRLLGPQVVFVTPSDPESGVPSLWLLPFKAADTEASRRAARLLFDQAFTDDRLQQLSYAASLFGRLHWLVDEVERSPQPDRTMARDRVLALHALAPARERTPAYLDRFAADAHGWRPVAVEWARDQLHRDAWARHWFRRFLQAADREEAWAAFRLFLRCVDRRWLLWSGEELQQAAASGDFQARNRHLILNRHDVVRKIKARAEAAGKRLCGQDLPASDLLPWKRGWRL
ncbi:MAG TPA: hypothetical protein VOA80_00685 [Thermoanaerobaculia bacterium]|nr:hypothetical protein [Thermoanaerobaculia bacterium]